MAWLYALTLDSRDDAHLGQMAAQHAEPLVELSSRRQDRLRVGSQGVLPPGVGDGA